jgi:hypothetical protein
MKNNVLDDNYSMLLGRPWDANFSHEWWTNLITIEGNGIVKTIIVTKWLDRTTNRPKVLLCYNFINGVTYEYIEVFFVVKLDIISIITISLPLDLKTKSSNFGIIEVKELF